MDKITYKLLKSGTLIFLFAILSPFAMTAFGSEAHQADEGSCEECSENYQIQFPTADTYCQGQVASVIDHFQIPYGECSNVVLVVELIEQGSSNLPAIQRSTTDIEWTFDHDGSYRYRIKCYDDNCTPEDPKDDILIGECLTAWFDVDVEPAIPTTFNVNGDYDSDGTYYLTGCEDDYVLDWEVSSPTYWNNLCSQATVCEHRIFYKVNGQTYVTTSWTSGLPNNPVSVGDFIATHNIDPYEEITVHLQINHDGCISGSKVTFIYLGDHLNTEFRFNFWVSDIVDDAFEFPMGSDESSEDNYHKGSKECDDPTPVGGSQTYILPVGLDQINVVEWSIVTDEYNDESSCSSSPDISDVTYYDQTVSGAEYDDPIGNYLETSTQLAAYFAFAANDFKRWKLVFTWEDECGNVRSGARFFTVDDDFGRARPGFGPQEPTLATKLDSYSGTAEAIEISLRKGLENEINDLSYSLFTLQGKNIVDDRELSSDLSLIYPGTYIYIIQNDQGQIEKSGKIHIIE